MRLPTDGEVRFVRAYLKALKELSKVYVEVLVKHCSATAQRIERGRRAAFLRWALHPGLVIPDAVPP